MILKAFGVAALAFGAVVSATPAPELGDETVAVNLDYATHQGVYNAAEDTYEFKNIRYADPPIGNLRFKAPMPVSRVNNTPQINPPGFKCPQAYPQWALTNMAAEKGLSTEQLSQLLLSDPLMSEDCLFLDVIVPKAAWNAQFWPNTGAPVLVWIHGGGYVFGHKNDDLYDPSGLIARSKSEGNDGVIYVALNYRLGLFGWLNGNGDEALHANAGLLDQRLALEWIQRYIGLFGGDPTKVTVMGQSAGAGSIMHHITAQGGESTIPFARAIVQSPGWEVVNTGRLLNHTLVTASTISRSTISDGTSLAALDYQVLNQINGALVFGSTNGSFTFSPTVDGVYVPGYATTLLYQGHFNSTPELMIGHNANEAGLFVSAEVDTEAKMLKGLEPMFSDFTPNAVNYILGRLYPSPLETDMYKTQYERACLIVAESAFTCNTRALAVAFSNTTYNYRFDIPPAVHLQDLPWTFYHGDNITAEVNPGLAEIMQTYFTTFARNADPNLRDMLPVWPEYGQEAQIVTFGLDGVKTETDDAMNARCEFWQTGSYRI